MIRYAHVQDGEIKGLNIPHTRAFGNTIFGKNSTVAEHVALGLLPIYGTSPSYDSALETVSGPTFVINGEQVDKVYVVAPIDLEVMKTKHKGVIKKAFDSEVLTGFTTVSTIHMDLDPTLLSSGVNLAVALAETDMRIRDFNNDVHDLTVVQVQEIIGG